MDDGQRFVRWYDLDQGNYEEDIAFYLSLAQRTGPPILELGCGTGRLVLALAQAGHQVIGVDHLDEMLSRAEEKLRAAGPAVAGRAQFLRSDIRQLSLPQRFPLVILAVNTFMHFETPADQALALDRAFHHLIAGGILALDLFHPHPDCLAPAGGELVLEKVLIDPETGDSVLKLVARQTDYAQQIVHTTFLYDHVDSQGAVTRTMRTFPMRYLHRSEAEQMLLAAGYVVEGIYGTYDADEYADCSDRMLILARRPEGQ